MLQCPLQEIKALSGNVSVREGVNRVLRQPGELHSYFSSYLPAVKQFIKEVFDLLFNKKAKPASHNQAVRQII